MINVVLWLVCGAIVGLITTWGREERDAAVLLFVAAGVLGALIGGVTVFIFDTTPLHRLSLVSLPGALAGALALVALARRLSRTLV